MAKKYVVEIKKNKKIIKVIGIVAIGGWLQEIENLVNKLGADSYLLKPYS